MKISVAQAIERAQVELLEGRRHVARNLLVAAVRAEPSSVPARALLAQLELADGRLDNCLKLLDSIEVGQRPQPGLHAIHGQALAQASRLSESTASFRRALCLSPARPGTWDAMMRDLEPLLPLTARTRLGRQASRVVPTSAVSIARRSAAALGNRKLAEALRLGRLGCLAEPAEVDAYGAFVQAVQAREFPSGTYDWGRRVRTLVPGGPYLSLQIAGRLMTDGRLVEGRSLIDRRVGASSRPSAAGFAAESRVLVSGHEIDRAIRAGRRGAVWNPGDPVSLIELTAAYDSAEEYWAALKTTRWIECSRRDPTYPYAASWMTERRSHVFWLILFSRMAMRSLTLDRPRDRLIAAWMLCDGVGYRHRLPVVPAVSTFDLAPPLVNSPVGHPRFNDFLGDLIFERLGTLAEQRVADIGGADGYFAFRAAERGARSVILEPSALFLERARLFRKLLNLEDKVKIVRGMLDGAHVDSVENCSIWLMLGLIYHLGNVVEGLSLATARSRVLVIEYIGTDDEWSDDDARLHKNNEPVSNSWLADFFGRADYTIEEVPQWAEFVADQPKAANRRLLIARPREEMQPDVAPPLAR